MLQRKICLLGAPGVGKRTIMSTFAQPARSENYQIAIGVRIAEKIVLVGEQNITMLIWDVTDSEGFEKTAVNYLRGMSGYLLVADRTRPSTLERAYRIYEQIYSLQQPPPAEPDPNAPYIQFPYRKIPFALLLNKSDLREEWRFTDAHIKVLTGRGWPVLAASAKENTGVEEAFLSLGQKILS